MEYSMVKGGKLSFKGEKKKSKKHKKAKKRKHEEKGEGSHSLQQHLIEEDTKKHGGWWVCQKMEEITGSVCIEIGPQSYISALDSGLFTVGAPRDEGSGPAPEEVLMALRILDTEKVSLKSGFDKYLSTDEHGKVQGRSDAIGVREQWEPIFQDGRMAFLGSNGRFMGVDEEGDIVCKSKVAGPAEFVQVRSNVSREVDPLANVPVEERGGKVYDTEVNYVKKFQSFQDRRLRVNQEDRTDLKRAKRAGTLHEVMLDRREKMKADRYCK
ncbi:protein FRG1-like [Watersipora subatra]|uniref:protein FRG1-like n=1 Tax=Watersipora subatra TaxID=2589382 RepID=UPI00355AD6CD